MEAKTTTPKTMSSRLMTMKFMQRAAASAASSPTTPSADIDGSAKRRKVSHISSAADSPQTPLYDQQAIRAALEAEEKKRQAAVEKRALELGDSHWVLNGNLPKSNKTSQTTLNVVQVGFAQIDSSSFSGEQDQPSAATPNGNILRFNMKKLKAQNKTPNDKSGSDSEESESDDEDSEGSRSPPARNHPDRGRRAILDEESRKRARDNLSSSRQKNERQKAKEFADRRRSKEIKSSKLTSISAAGGYPSAGSGARAQFNGACYNCGLTGHMSQNCIAPKKRR